MAFGYIPMVRVFLLLSASRCWQTLVVNVPCGRVIPGHPRATSRLAEFSTPYYGLNDLFKRKQCAPDPVVESCTPGLSNTLRRTDPRVSVPVLDTVRTTRAPSR